MTASGGNLKLSVGFVLLYFCTKLYIFKGEGRESHVEKSTLYFDGLKF